MMRGVAANPMVCSNVVLSLKFQFGLKMTCMIVSAGQCERRSHITIDHSGNSLVLKQ